MVEIINNFDNICPTCDGYKEVFEIRFKKIKGKPDMEIIKGPIACPTCKGSGYI